MDNVIEDKWKLALDASGDGIWDANMENNTIFFSEKWHEMFGYSSTDIVNLADWTSKIHPGDISVSDANVKRYLNGEMPNYSAEVRYKCKNGSYKWILSRGVLISKKDDGKPIRFIGTHTDINERKIAEQELVKSKELFSNSFNYSGTGKALLGIGGIWIEVNNVICELTGYTKEELINLHYNYITFPDDIGIDDELIKSLLNRELPSYNIEKRFVSKDRRIIYTILSVTLVWENDTTPKYFICDIVDITARKELTSEVIRKNHELETTLSALTGRINQIEELNRIIAHNLRGPIGNIKMLSGSDSLFGDKETLQMINDSSCILLDELDVMMDISQIRLDKNIIFDECNMERIVQNTVDQLYATIYYKHIEVTINLEVQYLLYPKIYLESIFYNLISNSVKYTRKDGLPNIEISTKNVEGKTQLIVKDNGLGIDVNKFHDRIFQLHHTFHPGHDSKGVGLFITKMQIEALGGSISVSSNVGEGTEFVVTFNV